MKSKYEQLVSLLEEMFQFNHEDLDFGIYRIMNQKRDEIRKFLREDLLPQVKEAFKKYQSVDQAHICEQLEQLKKTLQDAGVDPETSPKYQALQEQLAKSVDLNALENEVYSHLVTFFSRYYDNGDFISKRKYKKDVYAIPYEGEEVKLYWANADQYYVKTTEYFRNYSFKLPSGKKVHFVLTEASTEQNNNKEQAGKERRFILCDESPMYEEHGELYIRFVYKENNEKQATLNQQAVEKIFSVKGYADWLKELSTLAPTENNKKRTLLEKHLNDYTAKNTFDYFIHKDLGGFLRRELDFYIKNEIMHLDDLDTDNELRVEQYLSKIKVVKRIGHKIIKFLEQIENFQKKLWLKKKFVVETNYCVTLDRVPEELYPEIIQNQAQIEEWKRLFSIDEIEGYSNPITLDFLEKNQFLVLDTKFFERDFVEKLLSSFDNIDEELDGLLIKSENFQALNLLSKTYCKQVECIYIDPPYNTDSNAIVYKNGYKDSSWLSLIYDRLSLVKKLMKEDTVLCCAIDKAEQERLGLLFNQMFPNHDIYCIPIVHNPRGIQGKNFSYTHEYVYYLIPQNLEIIIGKKLPKEEWDYSNLRNWGGESERRYGRTLFYPIYVNINTNNVVKVGDVPPDDYHPESANIKIDDDLVEIWPIDSNGIERKWRYSIQRTLKEINDLIVKIGNDGMLNIHAPRKYERFKTVWVNEKYDASVYGKQLLTSIIPDVDFSFPKSVYTVMECVGSVYMKEDNGRIIDFFAGSGTTAHAVINLNREDGGRRKYILVEMGEYFDTVLKPRIQKVIYSKDWKDGKPVSREGISHMFKYIRLESYEDTLNNLELHRTEEQKETLNLMPPETREEYLLSYMLDIETEGSASLLNLEAFENPFYYKLKITNGSETTYKTVDLVETFNYLLGLTVRQVEVIQGFKVVKGELPCGERVLIIWRNLKEKSNEDLERFIMKSKYNIRDNEFDYIYVNGDNHLENIKLQDDVWKVKLIEEEFKRLMFDVQDV